jgi:hypothetical protein
MTLYSAPYCVYAFSRGATVGGYQLAGLSSAPPIVVQGAQFSDTDITLPITTLDQQKLLYVFGKQIADGALMGIAMLGMTGSVGLAQFVNSVRTSNGGQPVTLSTPLGGYRVAVTGWGLAPPDTEFNLQPFSILFKVMS